MVLPGFDTGISFQIHCVLLDCWLTYGQTLPMLPAWRVRLAVINKQWIVPIKCGSVPSVLSYFLKKLSLIFIFFWLRRK